MIDGLIGNLIITCKSAYCGLHNLAIDLGSIRIGCCRCCLFNLCPSSSCSYFSSLSDANATASHVLHILPKVGSLEVSDTPLSSSHARDKGDFTHESVSNLHNWCEFQAAAFVAAATMNICGKPDGGYRPVDVAVLPRPSSLERGKRRVRQPCPCRPTNVLRKPKSAQVGSSRNSANGGMRNRTSSDLRLGG